MLPHTIIDFTEPRQNLLPQVLGATPSRALRGFSSSECPANARTCSPSVRN